MAGFAQQGVVGFSMSVSAGPNDDDIDRLAVAITTFETEISDFTDLWDDVEIIMERNEEALFASQGASAGRPWDPLTEEYAKRKAEQFGNQPILVASGDLWHALTDSRSPFAVRAKTRDQFVFGTDLDEDYPSAHQDGYAAGGLPQRRPIDWPDEIELELAQALRAHTMRAARKSRLDYKDSAGDVTGPLMPGEA